MAHYRIKKGYDLRIEGRPEKRVSTLPPPPRFVVYPGEFPNIRPRLLVKEGDSIACGQPLFVDKRDERLVFRSPCGGILRAIERGERRFPRALQIDRSEPEESLEFKPIVDFSTIDRAALVAHLLERGLWPLIRQRPFDRIADPDREPKAIFINAAGTAPFQSDPALVLAGAEADFEAGLACLTRLTHGKIHLCSMDHSALPAFDGVENHIFSGRHPAGNTSVHIHHISPLLPHDTLYTVTAQDVVQIGHQLRTGQPQSERVIALSGPAVKPEFRLHYRVRTGASLRSLFDRALEAGEVRLIAGNVLWGETIGADAAVRQTSSDFFALHEDRTRHLFGWTMPGLRQYSTHRVNLSGLWPRRIWNLGTNLHGSPRSLVVTEWMDRHQPLDLMTDQLLRAVLAEDFDEAIELGILDTVPEDFALAAFADPHKTDVCGIIARGLRAIEQEGIR